VLGLGVIGAGLYPMALFLGIIAIHSWQSRIPSHIVFLYLSTGLASLYLINLIRLYLIAQIGMYWGGDTLQRTQAHLAWVLFLLFLALFWIVVIHKMERRYFDPSLGLKLPDPGSATERFGVVPMRQGTMRRPRSRTMRDPVDRMIPSRPGSVRPGPSSPTVHGNPLGPTVPGNTICSQVPGNPIGPPVRGRSIGQALGDRRTETVADEPSMMSFQRMPRMTRGEGWVAREKTPGGRPK
jgi:exosortase/archaeosortase family protein